MYNFACLESTEDTDSEFCIFHDRCYLKDDNYEKHTQKIAEKFKERLSKYRSEKKPLKFIDYCLPDISFKDKEFSEEIYFNEAAFYGQADFSNAKFSEEAHFGAAKFSKGAMFFEAKFSKAVSFDKAKFSGAFFNNGKFSGEASLLELNSLIQRGFLRLSSLE